MTNNQIPDRFLRIIDEQVEIFESGRVVTARNAIPDTDQIPIDDQRQWLRIPNVISVFVDMIGSTRLSAETRDRNAAGAYQLFTGTAVRLFHVFEAPYIDVRGDGVFALFNENQNYRALAAAVTFKTFVREVFVPRMRQIAEAEIGTHIGIDKNTVLVRKIGFRRIGGRTDRQNEVWAGKPVNMSAKLASLTNDGQMLISDRFHRHLIDHHAVQTCGCPNGIKTDLWEAKDLTGDSRFDFNTAYCLKTQWCESHGSEYCEHFLRLDR